LRYGQALGAERLVETNNVAGAFNASTPSVRALAARGFDAVYFELNLDSNDVVSALGARTNTEGKESTGAAALTGRIPYWASTSISTAAAPTLSKSRSRLKTSWTGDCWATGSARSCRTKSPCSPAL
jgi:hypothetical protein